MKRPPAGTIHDCAFLEIEYFILAYLLYLTSYLIKISDNIPILKRFQATAIKFQSLAAKGGRCVGHGGTSPPIFGG